MALDLARLDSEKEPAPPRAAETATAASRSDPDVTEAAGRRPPRDGLPKRSFLARLNEVQLFTSTKVTPDDLLFFTQQLALLLETGNPLLAAVRALAQQSSAPALKSVLHRIAARLEDGQPFSDCLEEHPRVFDSLFVSLVRAGEAGGMLRESLERITHILEVRRSLRARIREAAAYPCVLLAIMSGTLLFMLLYVIPKFEGIFAGMGDELPVSTRFLLGSAEVLRSRWMIVIPITMAGLLAGRWLLRRPPVRRALETVAGRLPLFGPLMQQASLFRLFSSFGLLLTSRVPLLEAIGITREIMKTAQYRQFFSNLARHVEGGRGVAVAFREAAFLPDTVKLMVSTGEQSGALDVVMSRLAAHYREELEKGIKRLSVVLEPLLLVVMGAMVGFVAISFIVPIFKMSRAIH